MGNTLTQMPGEIHIGPIVASHQQVIFVSCLFFSYIFSFVYYSRFLHSRNHTAKQIYIVIVANVFLWTSYTHWEVLQVYGYILFTFGFAKAFRKHWWMPVVNFAVILGMLSGAHIWRQALYSASLDKYQIDVTGVLMMLTVKLTSFAFDIRDAWVWIRRSASIVIMRQNQKKGPDIKQPNGEQLPPSEKNSRLPMVDNATKFGVLKKFPSFLEFAAYALLYPGVLTGPTVTFYEFRTFIDGSQFEKANFAKKALPGRKRRAFYCFVLALLMLAMYVGLGWKLSVSYMITDEFIRKPLWYRVSYLHFSNLVSRCKYYFAWIVAEGSYVIMGLGYRRSTSGKALWDRLENVNPLRLESSPDFRFLLSTWNICVTQWLNIYVYRRLQKYYGKEKSSIRATIITNFISAFWHGFYPGYYLMFISVGWMTVASRSKCVVELYCNLSSIYVECSGVQKCHLAFW